MPQVMISDALFDRAKKHAEPLIDTFESVLGKAFDALDAVSNTRTAGSNLHYSAASAPDLSFTSVKRASVDGAALAPAKTYWNNILLAVIAATAKHGATSGQIADRLLVNHVKGRKEEGGYRYIPEGDISVQGQDANGAWKATYFLAREFGIKVEVTFAWQNNPKAANPGLTGNLSVGDVFE